MITNDSRITKENLVDYKKFAQLHAKDAAVVVEALRPVDHKLSEKFEAFIAVCNDIRDYITSRGL